MCEVGHTVTHLLLTLVTKFDGNLLTIFFTVITNKCFVFSGHGVQMHKFVYNFTMKSLTL